MFSYARKLNVTKIPYDISSDPTELWEPYSLVPIVYSMCKSESMLDKTIPHLM